MFFYIVAFWHMWLIYIDNGSKEVEDEVDLRLLQIGLSLHREQNSSVSSTTLPQLQMLSSRLRDSHQNLLDFGKNN